MNRVTSSEHALGRCLTRLILAAAVPSLGLRADAELVNTKLNGPLATGGDVWDFEISPDGYWVVYRAEQKNVFVTDLYSVPIEGGMPVRLNSAMPQGSEVGLYEITPDSRHVVLLAPLDTSGFMELYTVPIQGPPHARIKLNKPLPTGGNVNSFRVSPDGHRVVYRAEQETDKVHELYSVPLEGPATAGVKISGPLVDGGDVRSYKISPDRARVVYTADQQVDDMFELYSVPIAGPADAWVKLNGPLVSQGYLISSYEITAGSRRVVFMAAQLTPATELFSVPIEGPASLGERINDTLVSGGNVLGFQVSPDGNRIVYRADQLVDEFLQLYSVPVAGPGSAATRISHVTAAGTHIGEFGISPDGGHVVYGVYRESDLHGMSLHSVAIDAPPGQSVKITRDPDPGGGIGQNFTISPDSAYVVSLLLEANPSDSEVFSVPIAGPSAEWKKLNRTVTIGASETVLGQDVEISPDGSRVLYRVHQYKITPGENRVVLYRVPIEGPGSASVPFNGPMVDNGAVTTARFAPDGEHVVYIADQDTDEVFELYVSYDRPTAIGAWGLYE